MLYEHNVSKFLMKDKSNIELEEFINNFYKNLRMFGQTYENEQFDDFLTELYLKEPEIYKEWHKLLSKIPYYFTKNNTILATSLVSTENSGLMVTAFNMEKKRRSIISRTVPNKVTVTTVNMLQERLLLELKKLLLLVYSEEEDNILRKAQEEFAKFYSEYDNDPYLSDYYNGIIDGFEEDLLTYINGQINKVDGIRSKITDGDQYGRVVDNMIFQDKNHRTSPVKKIYR